MPCASASSPCYCAVGLIETFLTQHLPFGKWGFSKISHNEGSSCIRGDIVQLGAVLIRENRGAKNPELVLHDTLWQLSQTRDESCPEAKLWVVPASEFQFCNFHFLS